MVDINIIHGNLTHINTGGSMKIKDRFMFDMAQKASERALELSGNAPLSASVFWGDAMKFLRMAYGL